MIDAPITLKYVGRGGARPFRIEFQDGETRCHVWASCPGEYIPTVHRYRETGEVDARGREKIIRQAVALHFPKYDAIQDQIAGLTKFDFDQAQSAGEARMAAEAAERERAERAQALERVRRQADALGFVLIQKKAA